MATYKKPLEEDYNRPSNSFTYEPFQVSGSASAADQNRQNIAAQKPGDFSYGEYQKSDAVTQAEAMLNQHRAQKPGAYTKGQDVLQAEALLQQQLANKPGAYQSQWQAQLDETLNKILNREKFSYDLNGDALYQQYKDQYSLQGQQAMMDAMGQAQAMTGGYANSYAQTVGQQTYQGYLQNLNAIVPELYRLALDQYNREGDALYNQYGLFADRENTDYGRYRDTVSDYYTELDRLTNDARYRDETGYNRYRDNVSDYYAELDRLTEDARYKSETEYNRYQDAYDRAYSQHRDSVADSQWQSEFDESNRRYNEEFAYQQNRDSVADSQWQAEFDESNRRYDESFEYQQNRDNVSDSQWQSEFDESNRRYDESFEYQQNRDNVSDEQWKAEFEEAQRQFNIANDVDAGGSSGSDNGTGGRYDPAIAQRQETLRKAGYDVVVDGIDGPQTQAAWADYQNYLKATDPSYRAPVVTPSTQGNGGGFTGSTYSEATAYLKANGQSASGLMTQSEWQRHRNNATAGKQSTDEGNDFSSYSDYVRDYVNYKMSS